MSCVHVPAAWCQGRTLDDDSRFMKHCRGVNGTHKVLKETAKPSDNYRQATKENSEMLVEVRNGVWVRPAQAQGWNR